MTALSETLRQPYGDAAWRTACVTPFLRHLKPDQAELGSNWAGMELPSRAKLSLSHKPAKQRAAGMAIESPAEQG